jgi:hypothetical protein
LAREAVMVNAIALLDLLNLARTGSDVSANELFTTSR